MKINKKKTLYYIVVVGIATGIGLAVGASVVQYDLGGAAILSGLVSIGAYEVIKKIFPYTE